MRSKRQRNQVKAHMDVLGWTLCGVIAALLAACATEPAKHKPAPTLHEAARAGDHDLLASLLANGRDVNESDAEGWSPLHHAAFVGHEPTAALLIGHGAEIDARDQDGWTPLHTAAFNGHLRVTELLLDHGADIHAKEADGDTPIVVANLRKQGNVVEVLVARGARFHSDEGSESFPKSAAADRKLIESPDNEKRLTRIKRYEPGTMSVDDFFDEGWSVADPFSDLIGVVGITQHENITRYHLGLESDEAKEKSPDVIDSDKKHRAEIFEKARHSGSDKFSEKFNLQSETAIVICVLTFRDSVLFSVDCPD